MYGFGHCGWDPCYPGYGFTAPIYGGCGPVFGGRNCFVLIVVLFILLIIIGTTFCGKC